MPTPEECRTLLDAKIATEYRLNAQSERLDEVIDEMKEINQTIKSFGDELLLIFGRLADFAMKGAKAIFYGICALVLISIFLQNALPLLVKAYGL